MLIRRDEHNIDKAFRKKLYDAQEAVPLHLWEGVRKKSSRRRFVYVWWMAAAILIAGIFYLGRESAQPADRMIARTWEPLQKTGVERNGPIKGYESRNSSASLKAEKDHMNDSASLAQNNETKSPVNAFMDSDRSHSNALETSESANRSRAAEKRNGFAREPRHAADTPNVYAARPPEKFDLNKSESSTTVTDAVSSPIPSNPEDEAEMLPVIDVTNSFLVLQDEILRDESLTFGIDSKLTLTTPMPRFQIGVYYALSQPARKPSGTESKAALNSFSQRTDIGICSNLGVALSFFPVKNISLTAGVEQSSFDEDHNWLDSSLVSVPSYTMHYDTTFSADTMEVLDIAAIPDTSAVEGWSTKEKVTHNRYTSVNIPVLLGYSHTWKRYSLGIEAGPIFRVVRKYTGSFVESSHQYSVSGFVPIAPQTTQTSETTKSIYSNWKTDIHIGLVSRYAFTEQFGISLGLQYRWMSAPAQLPKGITHRIVQPGISLSLNYRF